MLSLLFRLMSWLPLGLLHALGAALGRLVFALSPRYRRRLRANLAQAGYGGDRELERSAVREAGRFALELPYVWMRPPAEVAARVSFEQRELVEELAARGKGLILLTPHLGAFEVAARYCATVLPITVLYRPPRHPALRALVGRARTGDAMRSAAASLSGVRSLVRALRRGEAVGILPDQVPSTGEGRWAPFFGRDAYTMTLPARLAESTGAAVLLAACTRRDDGRGWRIRVERLDEPPEPATMNAALERLVRAAPEQYLWAYDRYKTPRGARTRRAA